MSIDDDNVWMGVTVTCRADKQRIATLRERVRARHYHVTFETAVRSGWRTRSGGCGVDCHRHRDRPSSREGRCTCRVGVGDSRAGAPSGGTYIYERGSVADHGRERHDTGVARSIQTKSMEEEIIRDIDVQSVMTRSSLPVGGYSVNPYVGCPHAMQILLRFVHEAFYGPQRSRGVRSST